MGTITESLIFSKELDNWRQTHGLTVTALAKLLGCTKQMMSEVLRNEKSFSAENLIKAKHILNIYNSMNDKTPQTQDDYETQNIALLEKYANGKKARLLHFQSGLGLSSNDGFVNREGASQPELADAISQMIKDGLYDKVRELLDQLQGPKVTHSTAEKASVNQGATRTPVAVVGGQNGARATWVSGQSFDSNGGILHFTKELIEFAKQDVKKMYDEQIKESYYKHE